MSYDNVIDGHLNPFGDIVAEDIKASMKCGCMFLFINGDQKRCRIELKCDKHKDLDIFMEVKLCNRIGMMLLKKHLYIVNNQILLKVDGSLQEVSNYTVED